MSHRFRTEENVPQYLDTLWGAPQWELYQAQMVLSLDLEWDALGLVSLTMDSGEISEETIQGDGLENGRSKDAYFQEAYVESTFLDRAGIAFKLGQQHLVCGEGHILDDFLPAGQVGLDMERILGIPWGLYAMLAHLRGSSFYTQFKAVHPFSEYERFTLSVGWLHDPEGFFGELLEDVVGKYPQWFGVKNSTNLSIQSEENLFWLSLSFEKHFPLFNLSATGILEGGRIKLRATADTSKTFEFRQRIPSLGYLVDVGLQRNLTERFSVELFWLMASGEGHPKEALKQGELFTSYLSIIPYVTRTNIFFYGGINESLSHRDFSFSGQAAGGFCVPGVSLVYFFTDDVWAEAKAAYLFTVVSTPAPFGGNVYGWETDLMGYWQIGEHVQVSFEADLFMPGSFFERPSVPDPDPAYRIMGGLDILF